MRATHRVLSHTDKTIGFIDKVSVVKGLKVEPVGI